MVEEVMGRLQLHNMVSDGVQHLFFYYFYSDLSLYPI